MTRRWAPANSQYASACYSEYNERFDLFQNSVSGSELFKHLVFIAMNKKLKIQVDFMLVMRISREIGVHSTNQR